MAADPLPDLTVEYGFGYTWTDDEASIGWVDESTNVRWEDGVSWGRGRSSQFERFQPGKASIPMRGEGRRFDPSNPASPYAGALVPNVPVRIRQGSTVMWRGFVDDWPVVVDGRFSASSPVTATDGLGILARCKLPSSWYALAVLNDGPVAWWRMAAQRDGDQMVDSSGNRHDGTLLNCTFGLDSLVNDPSDKAVSIDHTADARGEYYDATHTIPNSPPFTVEAFIQVGRTSAEAKYLWCLQKNAVGIGWGASIFYPSSSPDGELRLQFSGYEARGSTRLDDGLIHHVCVVVASTSSVKLYVDGVEDTLTTVTGGFPFSMSSANRVWTVGNLTRFSAGDFGLGGVIDEVAIYDRALSAGEVFNHAASAYLGGSSDGAFRIGEILDGAGWPAGQRDIHTFDTPFGTGDFDLGGTAKSYLDRIDLSEQGRQFVNAAGELVQLPRYWFLNTQTSPSLTLSDDPANTTAARYSAPQFRPPKELMKNLVTGSRANGPEVEARDQASIDAYGEFPESFDGMFGATDSAVRSTLEWVVARYKDPKPRLQSVTVDLLEQDGANRDALIALDCDQRVAVESQPASTGAQATYDLAVDGLQHRRTSKTWTVELALSGIDTDTGFGIWGTGVWDTALWA